MSTSAAPSSVTSASEHKPTALIPALRPAIAASRLGAMTTHRAGSGSRAGIFRPRVPPAPPMPPPKPSGSISMDARASCSAWGQGKEGAFGQGVGLRPPTGFGSSSQIHMRWGAGVRGFSYQALDARPRAAVGPPRRVRRHEEEQLGAVLVAQHRRRLFPFELPSSAEEALQVEPARAEIEAVGACSE